MAPNDIIDQARIDTLLLTAQMCRMILSDYIDEKDGRQFQHVLAYCKEISLIDDGSLAEIGHVKQATANRWIHGKNTPGAAARETILRKLIDRAQRRATALRQGLPELDESEESDLEY